MDSLDAGWRIASDGRETKVRLSAIFIALCMVLIAGSLGAVLYLYFGVSFSDAGVVAVAALTALAIVNSITGRARDRSDVGDNIADLSRGTADIGRQVSELSRRVAALEDDLETEIATVRAASQPLSTELDELGALVKQLAEAVASHEAALVGLSNTFPAGAPGAETADNADRVELGEPPAGAQPAGGRFRGKDPAEIAALIGRAVEANRVDLYLQPIVTLPQRKVRYYEAMSRLRDDDGELVLPADYLAFAETAGLMPAIDNLMLFRCVQVVRRLTAKNREVGLFCNVSASTLTDTRVFQQVSDFLEANRVLAPSLVFEFTQAALRGMGPIEFESLAMLAQLGFRFSLDRVADLRIEPRELAERGFRFVKVPATLLLSRTGAGGSDIHPADFSDLLGRFGIDLIAERIESEGMVVDLLDYDVRFGQGFLFSPPRPVRSEVLQGIADAPPKRPEQIAPQVVPEPRAPERKPGAIAQLARGVVRRA
jgi:cyclic-di-GMP phosphodiesterase TipF (flagellum assembly factor)